MAAKKRTVVCVKANGKGKWEVQLQGQTKPASSHRLKTAAVKRGRRIAKTSVPGQVKIFSQKGKVQASHKYNASISRGEVSQPGPATNIKPL